MKIHFLGALRFSATLEVGIYSLTYWFRRVVRLALHPKIFNFIIPLVPQYFKF